MYGHGVELYYFNLPKDELKKLQSYNPNHQLEYMHYKCFGVNDSKNSWISQYCKHLQYGLEVSGLSKIEIKHQGKKLLKIKADELLREDTLVPLYETHQAVLLDNRALITNLIYAVQLTGMIREYSFQKATFTMDDIDFGIMNESRVSENPIITDLQVKESVLNSNRSDSVVRTQRIIWI